MKYDWNHPTPENNTPELFYITYPTLYHITPERIFFSIASFIKISHRYDIEAKYEAGDIMTK